MKKLFLIWACLIALGILDGRVAFAIQARSFDWDDNIMVMPTKIVLQNQKTGEIEQISTAEYALVRGLLGKPGKYQDIARKVVEVDPTRNYFLEDIQRAIKTLAPSEWQGPYWNEFQAALQNDDTAKWTSIITGRMSSRETIFEALNWLKNEGYIKHVPRLEKIFPVGNKSLYPSRQDVSAIKSLVIEKILDELELAPLDGPQFHSWNFADDDHKNFTQAVAFLKEKRLAGRWAHVEISVTHTGPRLSENSPRTVVLGLAPAGCEALLTE